jgi:NADH-quinone oxidoreductase subunit E
MTAILDALARGETPKPGPQIDRQTSCPEGGSTCLKEMETENHDYRGDWS